MNRNRGSFFFYTATTTLLYWSISHLNWLLFKNLGVTPMPIWPAASVALIAALHFKWRATPGLILGTILANYFSLQSPLALAAGISIMNSLAPVCGALLILKITPFPIEITGIKKPGTVFCIAFFLIPFCTAIGGIGTKITLGLIREQMILRGFTQWFMAHMLGTLLLTIPYFTWLDKSIEKNRG